MGGGKEMWRLRIRFWVFAFLGDTLNLINWGILSEEDYGKCGEQFSSLEGVNEQWLKPLHFTNSQSRLLSTLPRNKYNSGPRSPFAYYWFSDFEEIPECVWSIKWNLEDYFHGSPKQNQKIALAGAKPTEVQDSSGNLHLFNLTHTTTIIWN